MVKINTYWGRIADMPKCPDTGLLRVMCSCIKCEFDPPQGVANCQDDNGSTPAAHLSFHSSEIDRA